MIFGDGSNIPTKVKMLLLAVGCTEPITNNTICELRKNYQDNAVFKRLFDAGQKMAAIADIPFVMVGYKKCWIEEIDDEDCIVLVDDEKVVDEVFKEYYELLKAEGINVD